LQNQAKKPNEMYLKKLFASMKRVGKIEEEFFKCYYILPRTVTSEDQDGKMSSRTVTPSDYKDVEFDMDIDVGAGGAFDEALQVNTLDMMYNKGDIDKYEYVKYAPNNMMVQGIKEDFEQQKVELDEQMEQQAQMQAEQAQMPQQEQLTPEDEAFVMQNPQLLDGL